MRQWHWFQIGVHSTSRNREEAPRARTRSPKALVISLLLALWVIDVAGGQTPPLVVEPKHANVSQEAPLSTDIILRRALEARGGEAAAERIRSFHYRGVADFAFSGRCDYEYYAARPEQAREIFNFGGNARYEFGFDGRTAWDARPGVSVEIKKDEQLRERRDGAAWFAWYDDPRSDVSAVCLGVTLFEGVKCHELKLISKSGQEKTHYYNADNYLLTGIRQKILVESKPVWREEVILEYRKAGGFLFPSRVRRRTEDGECVIRMSQIQINGVKADVFTVPAAPADIKDHSKTTAELTTLTDVELMEHFGILTRNKSQKPVEAVAAAAGILDSYAGQYYAGNGRIATVRSHGDGLWIQEARKPGCQVFPLSETNFFNRLFEPRVSFVRSDGAPTQLILGDPANSQFRGGKIPGQIILPTDRPLTEGECQPSTTSDIQGVWTGAVRPWYWPFYALHLKIRISEPVRDGFRSEMDCADLGVQHWGLGVIYKRPAVEVMALTGEGFFQGKINETRTKATGCWKQSGYSIRVTFRRVKTPPVSPAEPSKK